MNLALPAMAALTALALSACSRSDTSPAPEHSAVAAAMPDAAATPGAKGPATLAPHAPPPPTNTLSDVHPQPGAPAGNATATNTTP